MQHLLGAQARHGRQLQNPGENLLAQLLETGMGAGSVELGNDDRDAGISVSHSSIITRSSGTTSLARLSAAREQALEHTGCRRAARSAARIP